MESKLSYPNNFTFSSPKISTPFTHHKYIPLPDSKKVPSTMLGLWFADWWWGEVGKNFPELPWD